MNPMVLLTNVVMKTVSSDEEDEDEWVQVIGNIIFGKRRIVRIEGYVEDIVPIYDDIEFSRHFRLNRFSFEFLLDLISQSISRNRNLGHHTISSEKQLLLTLWFIATPETYRSVCSRFNVGESTGYRAVRKVIQAIYQLAPFFIKWPTAEKSLIFMAAFERKYNFPGVQGAIDGTHIRIIPPKIDPGSYVNRKSYHSIVTQVVRDHRLKFIHCYVGEAGSVHDARVLRRSNLPHFFHSEYFPNNNHLLGDAAYGISNYILTPFRDDGHLTRQEQNYNFCQSATRMPVERSIGLLKMKKRSIFEKLMMFRTDLIPQYVVALCVIHKKNVYTIHCLGIGNTCLKC